MRRRLTEEEHRLWAGAVRSVRPLRPRHGAHGVLPSQPPSMTLRVAPECGHLPSGSSRPPRAGPAAPMTPLAPLARREKQQLARGRAAIDARIDLHGLTQAQAHAALLRFLRGAQAEGAKFALVITGTGARGAEGERGVLKRQAPLWLGLPEFRPYVLGFETAHVAHGGAGALYVRLRRAQP